VAGIDILDGTPIFDIKPYVPIADCHPEATEGYTAQTKVHLLPVVFEEKVAGLLPPKKKAALEGLLARDPRPGYDDEGKEYGLAFAGYDVGFKVEDGKVRIFRIK
jgi:hypothetical protein